MNCLYRRFDLWSLYLSPEGQLFLIEWAKKLDFGLVNCYYPKLENGLPCGLMARRLTLDQFIEVRILAGQPIHDSPTK